MKRKPEMGKFLLYQFFRRDPVVRRYLPPTMRFSHNSLKSYVDLYGEVYVKPVAGSRGRGIVKVWRHPQGFYVQKTTFPPRLCKSFVGLCQTVDLHRANQAYIVQQGIRLAKVRGRPFDIRVMTQREKPGGEWQYSGMVAKVAGPGSIVTNVAMSRGTVISVPDALRQGLGLHERRIKLCMDEMVRVALRAAKHFDSYLLYRELGFDMAVDTRGRIWMLEQNTLPSHALFAKLQSDKQIYRKIQARWGRYSRAIRAHR